MTRPSPAQDLAADILRLSQARLRTALARAHWADAALKAGEITWPAHLRVQAELGAVTRMGAEIAAKIQAFLLSDATSCARAGEPR
jgi:hypothetical protein